MRKRTAIVVSALGGMALAVSAHAETLPPSLQALQQQGATLKVTTLRAATTQTVTVEGLVISSSTTDVDARTTPRTEAQITTRGVLLGSGSVSTVRVVGDTAYSYVPDLSQHDGGRPWFKQSAKGQTLTFGARPDLPLSALEQTNPLASLLAAWAPQNVQDIGPVPVNGAETESFSATVDAAAITSVFSAQVQSEFADLANPQLVLDVAPDGMPVRIALTFHSVAYGNKESVVDTIDIVAVNGPVAVSPPPADRVADAYLLGVGLTSRP